MGRTRKINKKLWKLVAKDCRICKNPLHTADVLDCHRIIPGEDGGTYTDDNVAVVCANCHRDIHAGVITIHRWVHSTAGRMLYITKNGEDRFI